MDNTNDTFPVSDGIHSDIVVVNRRMEIDTQSGLSTILIPEIVAITKHLPHDFTNVDVHMKSGTVFSIPNVTPEYYETLNEIWVRYLE